MHSSAVLKKEPFVCFIIENTDGMFLNGENEWEETSPEKAQRFLENLEEVSKELAKRSIEGFHLCRAIVYKGEVFIEEKIFERPNGYEVISENRLQA